ncbi:hypothetical protein SDC9_110248 [bioreactor metagenome]|uniref:Uncharacterized protein n=1 Tax=bioreactor metagenome TaxID=1076179 RepID=A0A645BE82_9ZZZZ
MLAAHEAVIARLAARIGRHLALQPAREQAVHLQRGIGGAQGVEIFGVRVAADHQRIAGAGVDELDHAVRGIAQTDDFARTQQPGQARQQGFGLNMGDLTIRQLARGGQGRDAELLQHVGGQHAPRLGAHAVQQHGQPFARQQQRQQRGEHRQLARAVVAGQHDDGLLAGGKPRKPCVRGVEKTAHLLQRLPLDAHGDAERTDLQVADVAVQDLSEKVGGLRAIQCLGTACAATDFLEIVADAHGGTGWIGCGRHIFTDV